ncbi:hypothetical protein [Candidatus Colwellia aromaticivorans]|uniref:hypothetical protein n=1 Tax=Candidatus Colwellia aromaticivorans TaxID=2267621 RepID=UPI000DF398F2|nr:hypothetical protein [Candidatus Colwellia aromaticivorans]
MNSLAYNDSNNFNAIEMEHKDAIVSVSKHRPNESQRQSLNNNGEVHQSDVSTASYIRGYN